MPSLEVALQAEVRDEVVAAELRVEATFTNTNEQRTRINRHTASHPGLVLEVRNSKDEPVLLAPPSAPGPADLDEGEVVEPGGSLVLQYSGFLDRDLPPGTYRVRYFGQYPIVGGARDDPLHSDWLVITVRSPRGFTPGIGLTGLHAPAPGDVLARPRGPFLWPIPRIGWLVQFWDLAYCMFLRIFVGLRCDSVLWQEIDQTRTETISNAPPGAEAWNGTYGWRARFLVTVDEPQCKATVVIRIRLVGTITDAQRSAWESAIESAWNSRFSLCCHRCCCGSGLEIDCGIEFVMSNEHQVVNVGTATTNMNTWGADDTIDVCHEFGHMLGALDEYFTVNGVDWGAARQPTGAIMNNPANPPAGRHYDTVQSAATTLLGTNCSTIAAGGRC
jgi:hypothetical protein